MINRAHLRLGKLEAKHDDRTLRLEKYIETLPPPPAALSRVSDVQAVIGADWGMMLNDSLGDCTIAALGHAEQTWAAVAQHVNRRPTDDAVGKLYIPGTGSDDTGRVELDVLNYVRKHGLFHHKLTAYAAVGRHNGDLIKHAIQLFGGSYIGVSLPETAQTQSVWQVESGPGAEPGSWGGHAVWLVEYDTFGPTCITWGKPLKMSWQFFQTYCDEAYALVESEWFKGKKTPDGLDLKTLVADLEAIK